MVGADAVVPDPGRIVIVGAGAAGARLADALRTGGHKGPITLLGDEPDPPYHRPLLSKEVLKAARQVDEILLSTPDQMRERAIDFRAGTRAVGVDRDHRLVHTATDGEVPYDTLVIATGVRPRAFGSAELGTRVHTLHTAGECLALREALGRAGSVAVVGCGFIGSEIAASVRELGLEVDLISTTRYALQNAVGAWAGRRISRMHEDHGVRMHMRSRVVDVVEAADHVRVDLADGGAIDADVAIIGVGSNPTTQWLEQSGLEIIDGLVVDEHGRTSDPRVWAVGDVARRRLAGGTTQRVEHWTSATEQADALARHLLGKRPSSVPQVDYLWTDMYGTKVQMLGHVRPGADEHVLLEEEGRFIVAYTIDERLTGVVAQGVAGRFMRFRVPVATGGTITELRALAA